MIGISFIRRSALTVLWICLAASVAADSNHPDLETSQVLSLDVAAIERDAQSGNPFELVLGDTRLTVVLTPAPIWPEEGLTILEVRRDGAMTTRVEKGNITYAGEVVGDDPEKSEVRFTIAGGVLQGSVQSSAGWWFIEPLARYAKTDTGQYLVYEPRHVKISGDFGSDGVRSDEVFEPFKYTCPELDGRIRVGMVADRQYLNIQDPFTYWQRQTALVNEISGIFWAQFRKRVRLSLSMADFDGTWLTSTNADTLLFELDNVDTGVKLWLQGRKDLCSDIVHLTTAKELDGITHGVAHQPGQTGLSQQAAGNTEALYYRNYILATHEIGHNFDAIHGEADEWCAPIPNDPFHCIWRHTLDWEAFLVTHIARFSDGTIEACNNNEQRMKVNMASRHLWP